MKKLEIPAPDEEVQEDDTALSLELWVASALALVLAFFGWFLWPQPEAIDDPYAHIDDPAEREEMRDRDEFGAMVEEGRIDGVDWTKKERRAARVFEVGPREAAEKVCGEYESLLVAGEAPRAVNLALLQAIDRRQSDAPWSCLLPMYLGDELPPQAELTVEMAGFWEEVSHLGDHGRIMEKVVNDLHHQDRLPQSDGFERWLRRCAVSPEYPGASSCRVAVRERAPAFGTDLLDVLIGLLEDPDIETADLDLAANALAAFAEEGQPDEWRIVETDALPDYNVDFRLGSLFMLCRLMNSPDEDVQRQAARELGAISGVGGRSVSSDMKYRWLGTCRRAFGDAANPRREAPFLGVSLVDDGDVVQDYGLDALIDIGLCRVRDDRPSWYCGAERWTGGGEPMDRVLGHYFARTAYVEWMHDGEPLLVLPGD